MAKFILRDAEYELVDVEDLTGQEVDDMERETSFNLGEGKVSVGALIWISVRRKYPQTTWQDIAKEKLLKVEWLADEDEADALPPTSSAANGSSAVDAPTELLAPTDSGNPG